MFVPFPKTPRLRREVVITEKIDGTNAAVRIMPVPDTDSPVFYGGSDQVTWGYWNPYVDDHKTGSWAIFAQSRNKCITPKDDNQGFAAWVLKNSTALVDLLGIGTHYGEWWGSGVNRGYGLPKGEKRFSLFQSERWKGMDGTQISGLYVVPRLNIGVLSDALVDESLHDLATGGSQAAPGFMRPEGVVVFHTASQSNFKVLLEKDEIPKALANAKLKAA